jgi:integrase
VGSATAFREFVNGTYLRCESSTLAKPTLDRYKGILKNYLLPAFGDKMLRELTPATLQAYFSGFANSKLSYESVDKIRDVLAAVLRLAAGKYGLLSTNPMKDIGLPRRRVGNKPKLHISPEQFDSLVRAIQEPYATMIFTAMHSGLRVSELVALKWGDLGYDSISIDERYCRGDWGEPKSQAANATIGLSRSVVERIHASWMVEAGADPKAVQGLMRHAKIQTTLDVYAQFVPASARRAIDLTSEMAERRIAAAKVTVH